MTCGICRSVRSLNLASLHDGTASVGDMALYVGDIFIVGERGTVRGTRYTPRELARKGEHIRRRGASEIKRSPCEIVGTLGCLGLIALEHAHSGLRGGGGRSGRRCSR